MGQVEGGGTEAEASPRAARTAARLRVAAREAFDEHGWQATRVQDIVERAGTSHGTFYTYYENKAAVLEDLVGECQRKLADLAAAPWEGDDVHGTLERVIGGLIEVYELDLAVLRTWLEASRDDATFRGRYVELRALFRDRVAENLEAVLAASERRRGPAADTIASALVAMVEHFAYSWLILGERHDREDAMAALVFVWGATLNSLAGFELVELH